MGINKRHGTVVFHCDICGVRRFDRDESRLTFVRAREDGWRLSKQHGKWETLCPDCALVTINLHP
jgi:predicted RNA-binding Zn-ribbon protein involved in translation (DUF1610 family)